VDVVPLAEDSPEEHRDAWAGLFRALVEEQLPELEPPSHMEGLAELHSDDERQVTGFLALDGDRPLGAVLAHLPQREDLDRADAALFVVEPARRNGTAKLLFGHLAERLRADGRNILRGDCEAGTPGELFASAIGARETQRVVRSRLDLLEVDPDDVAELAAREVPDYRVVTWSDRCPDELVDAFAEARAGMNDAPHGDAVRDPLRWDADRVRGWEDRQQRRGYRGLSAAVVHEPTGAVAGFTEIYSSGVRPRGVEQEDTAVVATHRGHGLGLLIKAVNLQRLLAAEPDTRWIVTWNAAENRYMRAVNERLGFQVCAEELELQLKLS
jgi:GNAT superfamily N-acetyltransferase